MKSDEHYMKIAIKEARTAGKEGEPPFGGVMIDAHGNVIAKSHDTVVRNLDMTCHSEINLVKTASKKIGPDLSGCTVYCTCEPCPLCFAALWLSRVNTVVFGSYMSDVIKISGEGQRELNIPVELMNEKSGKQIKIIKEVMRSECIKIWKDHKNRNLENTFKQLIQK